MYTQNQIVLSLGSNEGEKLAVLKKAISLINKTIGTVVNISPVYEFPAWGFESSPFYNCAILIHTALPAEKVIQKILESERELGRVRTEQSGYAARIIDIDIISFNQEIYNTPQLTVPHPLMQDRLFVLRPATDLELDWKHPIFKKSFKELLSACSDKTTYKKVAEIDAPILKYSFSKFNFIAIEGNIGAGKTTLVNRIAFDFNAKTILEGFADNPFLPKFYKDANRYAFPLEMSFLADRYLQLSDDLAQLDLFKEFVIADYYVFKSLIFAQITLERDEFNLYKQIFEIMYKDTPKPDLYIYLHQSTNRLLQNIQKRGRTYEMEISDTYLEKVNKGYFNYIKTLPQSSVLIIDISDLDFVSNQQDYISLLNQIQKKIETT
ncbi:2-amino-4-hydroxy-6-hydroxymethyldihydropteridine diphosphokinase [Myroides indicus]|uniref:2-amino-4-hydroxy-6-hydroxymethyldihydropteridine pyrophosphokinase n=1 Tax=Myroides indicus TaxID=1323422 RepID=A0A4V3E8N8_9FLAO|nr:2-amino-4-hydroxy-6-hydroxymethyldihydropteridine diphosphokinase [Myroides indicus]TDS61465.1 2-amino-4-hydroxy-6-hydroxymethyldihydropteridine diphosphokinase [Myroides indicus]